MTTADSNLQKELKKVSAKDREYIQSGLDMLGPDPERLGHMKNIFFGNINQKLVFPYPETDPEEVARCDQMIAHLDDYLRNEHPQTVAVVLAHMDPRTSGPILSLLPVEMQGGVAHRMAVLEAPNADTLDAVEAVLAGLRGARAAVFVGRGDFVVSSKCFDRRFAVVVRRGGARAAPGAAAQFDAAPRGRPRRRGAAQA